MTEAAAIRARCPHRMVTDETNHPWWRSRCSICGLRCRALPPMGGHHFDPGYAGLSETCNHLVMRDGYGDDCGLPREHPAHGGDS